MDTTHATTTTTTTTLCTPLELAGQYLQLLREYLLPEVMAQVLAGTRSHDDCGLDSNMLMAAAFEQLHAREPWLPSDWHERRCTEAQHDADMHLMNAAAALAMRECQHKASPEDDRLTRAITLVEQLYGKRERPTLQQFRDGFARVHSPLPHLDGCAGWSWEELVARFLPLIPPTR